MTEPDLPPSGLGELKKFERIDGTKIERGPGIKWGDEFEAWPVKKQLRYAKRLAASMNNAARELQRERDALVDICKQQDAQIDQIQKSYLAQGDQMHSELTGQDAEKQELYAQIVSLTRDLKKAKRRIKELGGD